MGSALAEVLPTLALPAASGTGVVYGARATVRFPLYLRDIAPVFRTFGPDEDFGPCILLAGPIWREPREPSPGGASALVVLRHVEPLFSGHSSRPGTRLTRRTQKWAAAVTQAAHRH